MTPPEVCVGAVAVPLGSVAGLDLVEGMAELLHQHGILPTVC